MKIIRLGMPVIFKILLSPFSIIYGLITEFRNWAYKNRWLASEKFDFPIVSIGNLSTGGTGKTPFTLFLIEELKKELKVACLSRGYGRSSKGYHEVKLKGRVSKFGDEPYLIKLKEEDTIMSVCENRIKGVQEILKNHPDTQGIILDDAFQHRSLVPSYSILLTTFFQPFFSDHILPSGNLRELRYHAKRANMVVVTKCPASLTDEERDYFTSNIKRYGNFDGVYFSKIGYGQVYHLFDKSKIEISELEKVLVVTGIATNDPLLDYVSQYISKYELLEFKDHHAYSIDDLVNFNEHLLKISANKKVILTTEKDAVKLLQFKEYFDECSIDVYVIPISIDFIGNEKREIIDLIKQSL